MSAERAVLGWTPRLALTSPGLSPVLSKLRRRCTSSSSLAVALALALALALVHSGRGLRRVRLTESRFELFTGVIGWASTFGPTTGGRLTPLSVPELPPLLVRLMGVLGKSSGFTVLARLTPPQKLPLGAYP